MPFMHYLPHLQNDAVLASIISAPLPVLESQSNMPLKLMGSIMSQQLSTKVAAVIYQRFIQLVNSPEPTPQQVLALSAVDLRAIGLSHAKIQYVHNVAQFCIDHQITDTLLAQMTDDAIVELLTQIKGVGRWTVEMLLMFGLGREDVFAVDDLGIHQAMVRVYQLTETNKKQLKTQMMAIADRWKPYRTYACMYLWRYKDAPTIS